jgi:hypothetical protein
MGLAHSPRIVTDGLVLCLDAANSKSYPGSGSNIFNLIDNTSHSINGNFTYENGAIRLLNNTGVASTNTSRINLNQLTNITTVSLWFFNVSSGSAPYLLDMRTGGGGGWIYAASSGSNWSSGSLYKNGGGAQSISWAQISTTGAWQNITVIANTPATDDMTLFSRFSNNEGMDVNFSVALVYNRVLTETENNQNFNALRGRYGL